VAEPTDLRPMFPLGSVLVPTGVLPLHVFEPRFLALVEAVRASQDQELGVVLIERGSEVGGGDVRTSVGTVARLVRADPLPGDRWAIVAVGVRRIRVEQWLPDDPYPRAEVSDWPDTDVPDPAADPAGAASLGSSLAPVVERLRTALALAAELGEPVAPTTVELSDDPVVATFQVAAVAPLGPADQQRILSVPGAIARIEVLASMLDDLVDLQRARLALG
jgi:uncharacterized protein